jgi:hypothetical protein
VQEVGGAVERVDDEREAGAHHLRRLVRLLAEKRGIGVGAEQHLAGDRLGAAVDEADEVRGALVLPVERGAIAGVGGDERGGARGGVAQHAGEGVEPLRRDGGRQGVRHRGQVGGTRVDRASGAA